MVKHLPTGQETWLQSLGREDPLGKEMATHSSILAWKISWTEDLVGYSPWGRKESDATEQLSFFLSFLEFNLFYSPERLSFPGPYICVVCSWTS